MPPRLGASGFQTWIQPPWGSHTVSHTMDAGAWRPEGSQPQWFGAPRPRALSREPPAPRHPARWEGLCRISLGRGSGLGGWLPHFSYSHEAREWIGARDPHRSPPALNVGQDFTVVCGQGRLQREVKGEWTSDGATVSDSQGDCLGDMMKATHSECI